MSLTESFSSTLPSGDTRVSSWSSKIAGLAGSQPRPFRIRRRYVGHGRNQDVAVGQNVDRMMGAQRRSTRRPASRHRAVTSAAPAMARTRSPFGSICDAMRSGVDIGHRRLLVAGLAARYRRVAAIHSCSTLPSISIRTPLKDAVPIEVDEGLTVPHPIPVVDGDATRPLRVLHPVGADTEIVLPVVLPVARGRETPPAACYAERCGIWPPPRHRRRSRRRCRRQTGSSPRCAGGNSP